jgi:trigger factor
VPSADIDREVDVRLKKMGKTARLKGFRPGKVPPKVVRKRYGSQIRQEVLGDVIRSSFSHAVTEKHMNPAGGPSIEPLTAPGDTHFAYRATFEVYPEIVLCDISALNFEAPEVHVEDDDVDKMIERLRKQRGTWKTVERPAADGDQVTIDFFGKLGKEPFEGGEGNQVKIVLGAEQVIADFEKALIGLKAGDEKTAKVKFPKDYGVATLAGKRATFEITVHSVEELELPAIDDEFMAAFGVNEGGVEALRTDVRKNMQRELDQRLREVSRASVLDALHDAHAVELPKTLVDQEAHALQHEAMRRMGVENHDQAPAVEGFKPMAEKRVRLSLLVQELIAKEQIALDRTKVEERIQEMASPYEVPEEAAQIFRGNKEMMAQIESSVLEGQVVDFVIEHGQPNLKKLGFDEFMNMQDAE